MRNILLLLLAACLLFTTAYSVDQPNIRVVNQPEKIPSFLGYEPGKLIVKMKETSKITILRLSALSGTTVTGIQSLDAIAEKYDVNEMHKQFVGARPFVKDGKTIDLSRYYKIIFDPNMDLDEVYNQYLDDPNVESVEKVGMHTMYATPNDGYYSYQWHLNQTSDHDIDAPEAWNIEAGADATIVAILDSGTRYYHPDLGGANASPTNVGASRGNMWINTAELN